MLALLLGSPSPIGGGTQIAQSLGKARLSAFLEPSSSLAHRAGSLFWHPGLAEPLHEHGYNFRRVVLRKRFEPGDCQSRLKLT
jgi:hypothetical protein